MRTLEVVDADRADMERFTRLSASFFGEPVPANPAAAGGVLNRAWLARDGGEEVGTAGVIDFTLTLPGSGRVPMSGVTWVAVSPVARRRGALRTLMERMLDDARARAVPVLGLGASESAIYRRFGYGVATYIGFLDVDTAHAAFRVPYHDPGQLRSVPLDQAMPIWLDVESRQPDRVGGINRSEASWRRVAAAAAESQGDLGPVQVVAHQDALGVVDGFVNYRLELRWPDEVADGIVHVRELSALNRDAHLALWQHLLGLDLVEHLRMQRHWLDDPIQHHIADWRRLRVRSYDDLHLRVVDVAALLQTRRYSREDSLVLEVRDPTCPDLEGRYRLDGGLDGASAAPTDATPDLVLDGPSLGSLLLGDVSAAALHCAGLIEEVRPQAVRRASAMFSWSPRPWLNYMF